MIPIWNLQKESGPTVQALLMVVSHPPHSSMPASSIDSGPQPVYETRETVVRDIG